MFITLSEKFSLIRHMENCCPDIDLSEEISNSIVIECHECGITARELDNIWYESIGNRYDSEEIAF